MGADAALLMGAVVWGVALIARAAAASSGIAFLVGGVSSTLATLILSPFALKRLHAASAGGMPGAAPRNTRRLGIVSAAAGTILFAATAFQQVVLLATEVANAGFLSSLYSVITPFLLLALFREPPAALDIATVFIAALTAWIPSTGGTAIILNPGDSLEITGALFWARYFVVIAKLGFDLDTLPFAAGQYLVCVPFNLGVGLFVEPVGALTTGPVMAAIAFGAGISMAGRSPS